LENPIGQYPQNVNVTGPWSLNLAGRIQRHLDLDLTQANSAVLGRGIINDPNGTQRVAASGSLVGGRLVLTAMLVDSLDLYKLNLSLNSDITGAYTAYSAIGATWSGDVFGSAPSGISDPGPKVSEAETETAKETTGNGLAKPGLLPISASSSTSIGMSSASGTNGMESYSSTSESA
jgi:hypothetical protein